jgi:four helix bundle protein
VQDYRNLGVWMKAHALTLEVYRVTGGFPQSERFGLTDQMRRASASIGTNIAEGCGRASNPDFARFLQIAMGSANEIEYQLLLAYDLNYLPADDYLPLSASAGVVKKMLTALIKKVKASD